MKVEVDVKIEPVESQEEIYVKQEETKMEIDEVADPEINIVKTKPVKFAQKP